jgi:putative glutamine amidotransferase
MKPMPPRIAMPHSMDRDYSERSIPQYELAVQQAGGQPVRVPLDQPTEETKDIIAHCDGVLLPGSGADVDPAKFNATRSSHTAPADIRRDAVDRLLLEDAYRQRKPILGICYGLQSLNVYRAGSLVQHIPDFLPQELRGAVDHEAGRKVAIAHAVEIADDSRLAEIVGGKNREGHDFSRAGGFRQTRESGPLEPALSLSKGPRKVAQIARASAPEEKLTLPVNSSHHQSADKMGNGLRISARCTADGIIEALEGTELDHFVLAVQWHPERSIENDEPSRALFAALVEAAAARKK